MTSGHHPVDGIKLIEVENGEGFPAAPVSSIILSSAPQAWRGIIVEWQKLEPQELREHYIDGYGITVNVGKRQIPFGWTDDDKRVDGVMNPGDFHLLTRGEPNAPRWSELFDEVSFVLEPKYIADVAGDGLPTNALEFVTQRSGVDATVTGYAEAFKAELAGGSPNGRLYVETLTIGLILHLLFLYAIAKPRVPCARGKLNSFQLRRVVDFIMGSLSDDPSVLGMAEQANVSPFHFARMFRKTVGVTPHQFVLRQRVQRSVTLLDKGGLPLSQVAAESGFYDQAHFTHAFRSVMGVTPARYARMGRKSPQRPGNR